MPIQIEPACPVEGDTHEQHHACGDKPGKDGHEPGHSSHNDESQTDSIQRSEHEAEHRRPARKVAPLTTAKHLLLVALVASACTAASEPPDGTPGSSQPPATFETTSTSATSTTTSTIPPEPTTSTTLPRDVLGLVTPNGIPVAVNSSTAEGYNVVTPCGHEALVTEGEPLYEVTVVLDPGHGGTVDTGAVGPNGLAEKEINLEVAERASQMLTERGIDVVLTRTGDYATPLSVRANLADTLRAQLMVSIHHNSPTQPPSDEPGIEIFIQNGSDESARLGGLLWEHTRARLGAFDVAWVAAEDAGVMTVLNTRGSDAYGIIRNPATATALVELGYISNQPEAELFATPLYPRVAARAITEGVVAFLESDDRGSGFVEGRVFNPSPGISQAVCTDPELG